MSELKHGIVIAERQNNPDMRVYHTKAQLTESAIEYSVSDPNGSVCSAVLALPGVCEVFVRRYSISVVKGTAWAWDEVEPAILEFLGAFGGHAI